MFFLISLLLIPSIVCGESFSILELGGWRCDDEVHLYQALSDDPGCALRALPERALHKPFGNLMNGNVTVCSGSLDDCFYLKPHSSTWLNLGFGVETFQSSLTTTFGELTHKPAQNVVGLAQLHCSLREMALNEVNFFLIDNSIWTFFGGFATYRQYVYVWHEGVDKFEKQASGLKLERPCSTRFNQTHVIVSHGPGYVYWYEEGSRSFKELSVEGKNLHQAACGLIINQEGDVQFAISGGEHESEVQRDTQLFDFASGRWVSGESLSFERTRAAHVQHQNTFLVVGGQGEEIVAFDDVLQFDSEDGWMQMPMKLKKPNYMMGAMRVPPGLIQCQLS